MKRERNVRRKGWAGALRPVPVLAALGVALAGCADAGRPRPYGGGYFGSPYYGGPGYYGSPYYGYGGPFGYNRYYGGPRFYGGGHSPSFRGPGVQEGLRQHWIDQARRAR